MDRNQSSGSGSSRMEIQWYDKHSRQRSSTLIHQSLCGWCRVLSRSNAIHRKCFSSSPFRAPIDTKVSTSRHLPQSELHSLCLLLLQRDLTMLTSNHFSGVPKCFLLRLEQRALPSLCLPTLSARFCIQHLAQPHLPTSAGNTT